MTATGEEKHAPSLRHLLSLSSFWFILRSPKMFAVSLLATGIVLLATLIIPQQPVNFATPGDFVVWYAELPPFFQQVYPLFNALSLFKIYRTFWFWLPMAWLTLSALINLADYTPAVWQRIRNQESLTITPVAHPLIRYRQNIIRLTAPQSASESTASEAPLAALSDRLTIKKFQIRRAPETGALLASRYAWRWSAPILVFMGVLLLVTGGVLQALWGQSEAVLLSGQTEAASFINHSIALQKFTPFSDQNGNITGGSVSLNMDNARPLNWQLQRPYQVGGWWVVPAKISAVAEITFAQQQAVEKVSLIFDDVTEPLYFFHSPANLTFKLRYVAAPNAPAYRLSVIQTAQSSTSPIKVTQQGKGFSIPGANLQGSISIENKLLLRAYKLPAVIPFALGGALILLGLLQIPLPSPAIVRLQTIKKGRGSKITAQVETLGDNRLADELIEQTLVLPNTEHPQ
ncbi:MAG TPA: cytochrome c biogenesis protein ResB [Chloroflexi bacterium]|nr:cytochrome c biogenesis protein ResB [Chloroflexota bacterium]